MYEKIIENYINKLTLNDISFFALKNSINLNDSELDYIYKVIKKDYKILLSNNYESILIDAKNYLSEDNYKKICNLFLDYRNKFQSYLN